MTYQDSLDSQYLSTSLSSLSRSRSTNNLIVRTYKQAVQLYLTKRFKEAIETLEPIISAQQSSDPLGFSESAEQANGNGPAPVAQSSKSTRVKVWVFYISLIHAIVELGAEQGKAEFGSTKWRQLVAKAREGTVWDEIVQRGYGGEVGEMDADIVVNLATLFVEHMPSQKLNQQRLENWLSSSSMVAEPTGRQVTFASHDGISSPLPTGTVKALATRLKVLELYTLHVLPANEEWEYAQSFIEMNDTLDEERREEFLYALQNLKSEKDGTAQRERELKEQREREMEEQRREEEAKRAEQARKEEERRKAAEAERLNKASSKPEPSASFSKAAAKQPQPNKPAISAKNNRRPPTKKTPPNQPPATFYNRASSVLINFQRIMMQAGRSLSPTSTMAMLRMLMFIAAFLTLVARQDLRMKVRRALGDGWDKIKGTVGMATKVSYI